MDKHPIEDILKHYGMELPYGRNGWVKVKCCFHSDSHASAAVNFKHNQFKCFACDAAGDTYDLIMKEEGVDFVTAREIAERISPTGNAELRSVSRSGRGISRKPRIDVGRRSKLLGGSS